MVWYDSIKAIYVGTCLTRISDAKISEICVDLTLDRVSGERRPTVARYG